MVTFVLNKLSVQTTLDSELKAWGIGGWALVVEKIVCAFIFVEGSALKIRHFGPHCACTIVRSSGSILAFDAHACIPRDDFLSIKREAGGLVIRIEKFCLDMFESIE